MLEEYYHDHPEERNLDSDYQSDYFGEYMEKEQIPFSKFRGTQQMSPGYDRYYGNYQRGKRDVKEEEDSDEEKENAYYLGPEFDEYSS